MHTVLAQLKADSL